VMKSPLCADTAKSPVDSIVGSHGGADANDANDANDGNDQPTLGVQRR